MASESVFQATIQPFKVISRLFCFPCCFEFSQKRWEKYLSWVLFTNLVLVDLQLLWFCFVSVRAGNISSSIISGSIGAINLACTSCAYFWTQYRHDFTRLMDWCEMRHQLNQKDPETTRIIHKVLKLFVSFNLGFILAIFGVSIIANFYLGTLNTTYFTSIPFIPATNIPTFLLNEASQCLACWYGTLLGTNYLCGYFLSLKYMFDHLDWFIELLKSSKLDRTFLIDVIEKHNEVLEMYKVLGKVSSYPFMALTIVIYPLSFLGFFSFYMELEYRIYGFAIASLDFEVFAFFFISDMLFSKFEEFYWQIYELDWPTLQPREQKAVLVILAQQVPVFKAAGIYPVTLEMYQRIVSKVYSTCLVLQDML